MKACGSHGHFIYREVGSACAHPSTGWAGSTTLIVHMLKSPQFSTKLRLLHTTLWGNSQTWTLLTLVFICKNNLICVHRKVMALLTNPLLHFSQWKKIKNNGNKFTCNEAPMKYVEKYFCFSFDLSVPTLCFCHCTCIQSIFWATEYNCSIVLYYLDVFYLCE